jgi:hypothetical protein
LKCLFTKPFIEVPIYQTFNWSVYIPNRSLKCLYTKPFIEVPIYQTFHWSAYIPNLSLKCLYTKPFIEVSIYQTFVTGIDSASVFTILLFYFVPIVRYFCFSFYIHFMSIYSQNRCTFTVFNTYTGCSGEKNAVINTVCTYFWLSFYRFKNSPTFSVTTTFFFTMESIRSLRQTDVIKLFPLNCSLKQFVPFLRGCNIKHLVHCVNTWVPRRMKYYIKQLFILIWQQLCH